MYDKIESFKISRFECKLFDDQSGMILVDIFLFKSVFSHVVFTRIVGVITVDDFFAMSCFRK